jgi:hypothetical protein
MQVYDCCDGVEPERGIISPFFCTKAACVLLCTPCLSKPPAATGLGCQAYRAEANHFNC